MKIAIASDFHLGYERFRSDAFRQAETALEMASKEADAIIIPGDIFDMRNPKPDVLAEAINLFRNLSKKEWRATAIDVSAASKAYTDVPILAIPGTHERRAKGAENPVNLLGLAGLLVDISDGAATLEKDGEKVLVYGIGGVSEERFLDTIKTLDPKPLAGHFSIFMFHQSAYELLPFSDDFIHLEQLPEGFDLYVNGHIHNRVEKKVHGKHFLIPGSTVLTQLKDAEQEEKGFFVFDTKAGTYSFHKIPSRRFVVVKIEADGKDADGLTNDIKKGIESAVGNDTGIPVVRVEISGSMKKGVRSIDLDAQGIIKEHAGRAIVEIAKPGVEESIENDTDVASLRKGSLENMSVKDYGLGIFIEKLKNGKYDLGISPSELFEMLSDEGTKEKTVKKALEELFSN
ncbi:MAG: metallophosphoesterase family protein [Candidatus Marsarchaeota archaeon]|nr:metallophosphoesterase family protein [Candidatus Marsarchaeota archaeon]